MPIRRSNPEKGAIEKENKMIKINKTKKLCYTAIIAALAVLLSGCAGNGEDASASGSGRQQAEGTVGRTDPENDIAGKQTGAPQTPTAEPAPTTKPATAPTAEPATAPTAAPATVPTEVPATALTAAPATAPTEAPATAPTEAPTTAPTPAPTPQNRHDELAADMERTVRELYEQKLILREAVRTIVAQRIDSTAILTVDPREKFSVTEVLLDGVSGNPVVSEGIRAFARSAAEGKSIQEMCKSALEGGAAQIPDYLTGKLESSIQDAVTSFIGVDIFAPIEAVSKWTNPKQEPTVLLQGIVEEQQKDVGGLALFLQQEEISTADIYKVAQMVYAVMIRDQEIAAAWGEPRGSSGDAEKLRRLAEQYAETEARLSAYAGLELPETVSEDRERISGLQAEAAQALEKYAGLCSLPIGNVAANYDVEGFRETQKQASQQGMIYDSVLGGLMGGAFAESDQVVQDQIQENRYTLCEMLTDTMEESYVETVAAQGRFEEQYRVLGHMAQAQGNEQYFAGLYLEKGDWREELESAAKGYLTSLSKYLSDVDSAAILYNCILTKQQTDYLFNLQLEIDALSKAVGDFEWYGEGYSNDEILERWSRLVDCYMESVTYIAERGGALGQQTPGFCLGASGKQGGIDYKAYIKELGSKTPIVMIQGGGRTYYYDAEGNLICVDAAYERILGRHFYLLSYQSFAQGATRQTSWGSDPGSAEMQKMTQQSVKAQELYKYFGQVVQ